MVSYLSGNSRREEFALLRLQGVKKMKSSLLFLVEQMILVLMGNLIGDVVMLFVVPSVSLMFVVNGILLILMASAALLMTLGSDIWIKGTKTMAKYEESFMTIGTVRQEPDSYEEIMEWDAEFKEYNVTKKEHYDS